MVQLKSDGIHVRESRILYPQRTPQATRFSVGPRRKVLNCGEGGQNLGITSASDSRPPARNRKLHRKAAEQRAWAMAEAGKRLLGESYDMMYMRFLEISIDCSAECVERVTLRRPMSLPSSPIFDMLRHGGQCFNAGFSTLAKERKNSNEQNEQSKRSGYMSTYIYIYLYLALSLSLSSSLSFFLCLCPQWCMTISVCGLKRMCNHDVVHFPIVQCALWAVGQEPTLPQVLEVQLRLQESAGFVNHHGHEKGP